MPQIDPHHHMLATALRFLAVDGVEQANSGHPGLPLGMADVVTVLYRDFLKFDASAPFWPDRDRFILSAGHGSMLLYALNCLSGYSELQLEDLRRFRQLHSRTPGHPEHDVAIGVEMTTGPLGQGIATSVGFALAEAMARARFGTELVDHRTWVLASDGDMMEGVSHEACSLAGHLKLGKLNVLYDSNSISIDGDTSLSFTDDTGKRFESYGWHVTRCDGHDPADIKRALQEASDEMARPTLVICKTVIGHGAATKSGHHEIHGTPLGRDEMAATRLALKWGHEPFVVPDDALQAWRAIGRRGRDGRTAWEARRVSAQHHTAFETHLDNDIPAAALAALQELKAAHVVNRPAQATRKSSGDALNVLVPRLANLIGGSADLTPSNNTRTKDMTDVTAADFSGNYLRYGVREHGMSAIMNGLALHGGFIPYSGTFLTFSDYSRPAIRLAALMQSHVIHVMTHDSIGLGEDGPTHQPVEHLAALRAIPNVQVLRPCDAVETAEAWELALTKNDGPTILALSRQNVPALRQDVDPDNLAARGGYILRDVTDPKIILIATGTEVSLAVAVAEALSGHDIAARVVSMPCREIFCRQPHDYQLAVIGDAHDRKLRRVVIEAGVRQGWEGLIGLNGMFCGVENFGLSAPYQAAYAEFGLTVEAIVAKLLAAV